MSREAAPQTPLRRSKRGQPLVSEPTLLQVPNLADAALALPVFTRTTQPNDLYEEEQEAEDLAFETLETRFYAKFVRREPTANRRVSRGDGKARSGAASADDSDRLRVEEFKIGDPVVVKTLSKEPSIAIIAAIWEVVQEGEPDDKGLRVMVHWFSRPSELPAIRARREHLEVCRVLRVVMPSDGT